jgi:peptidyl-prolyl cis-trans isomerase NIMA-interacting 1
MSINKFNTATPKFIIIGIFVLGCGSTHKSSEDAKGATQAERQCIAEANAPPKDLNNAPARVTVSHIVVRHKSLAKSDGVIRTRGQACLRALEARDELRDAADWSDVVAHFSDLHESNDGDLGVVRKGEQDRNFERAAFSLNQGELSYVVETDRGFEIILRTK